MAHYDGGLVRNAGVSVSGSRGYGFMTVGDVAEMAALLEVAVDGIEHSDYGVSAEAEDVFDLPALKVIYDEISYQLFAHAGKYLLDIL